MSINPSLAAADPDDLRNRVMELERRLTALEQQPVRATAVSEVFDEFGEIDYVAVDANGRVRFVMSGVDLYDEYGVHAHLIALDADGNITWYTSADDGSTVFVSGNASIGIDGLFIQGMLRAIKQLMDDGAGNVRYGYVGSRLLEGETIPSFGIEYEQPSTASELVVNGVFASNISDWDVIAQSRGVWEWATSLNGKGGVCGFRYTDSAAAPSGKISRAVDVSPSVQYQFSADLFLYGLNVGKLKLHWYDTTGGTGSLLRTDTVWNGAYGFSSWNKKTSVVVAPDDAASVVIECEFTSATSGTGLLNQYMCALDNVSLKSGADAISNYLMFHPDTAHMVTRDESGFLARLAFASANLIAIPRAGASLSTGGSLTVGQAYYYKLTYYDASGETIASDASSPVTPTSGNQKISVRAFINGTFRSVPRIPGAVGFNVYRSTNAVDYYYLVSVASPTQSYSDDGSVAVDTNRRAPTINTTSSRPFYPTRATIWGVDADASMTVQYAINASQAFNHYSNVTAANANDGDSRFSSFFLAAGEYEFEVLGLTAPSCGKVDYYIDDVLVASGQDWYAAALTENELKTFVTTIQKGGYHKLEARINGKHASSTDYRFLWTRIHIHPRYED